MTTTQGSATSAAAIFLGPGEGPAIHMGSLPLVFKALSAWTNGAYEMHEQRLGPGVLVAPHTHVYQDQVNYVLPASASNSWSPTRSSRRRPAASSGDPAASGTRSG